MTWYKELKFTANPLDIRPNPNLIGLKDEEKAVINHILKEEICFVNGLTGSGKTSLLKRVQRVMKNHSFIYLDAHDLPQKFSLERELKKKRNFFDRITLRDFPKEKPVLIIDEFQATDPRIILNAKSKWEDPDKRLIKSIIIAQISKHLDNCSKSFKERLGSKVIELRTLTEEELKEVLRRRLFNKKQKINYAEKFNEDALSMIVKCSGKNPRKLLEYADMVFDYHHKKFGKLNPVRRNDYVVSTYVVKQILEESNVYVESIPVKQKEQKVPQAEAPAPILQAETKAEITNLNTLMNNFDDMEKEILKHIDAEPRSIKDIAKNFNISNGKAKKYMDNLKKNNCLVSIGKKGRMRLWELTPETKRILVDA